jgi:hypothetical protein
LDAVVASNTPVAIVSNRNAVPVSDVAVNVIGELAGGLALLDARDTEGNVDEMRTARDGKIVVPGEDTPLPVKVQAPAAGAGVAVSGR